LVRKAASIKEVLPVPIIIFSFGKSLFAIVLIKSIFSDIETEFASPVVPSGAKLILFFNKNSQCEINNFVSIVKSFLKG